MAQRSDSLPSKPRRVGPTRATLKDVALNAGVSIGTVSDIVNRGLSDNYSSTTQARVRAAIQELGYRPARAAQNLRRGRTDTISVILSRGFENPYYARLFNEIKLSLESQGFQVEFTVRSMTRKGVVQESSDWIISHGAEALIVGPVYYWQHAVLEEIRELKDRGVPIIAFGVVKEAGMCQVQMEDDDGGRCAAQYLLDRGHRRIAFLGAYARRDAHLGRGTNQEGVEDVLTRQGLLDVDWLIECPDEGRYEDSFDGAERLAKRWLASSAGDRPTALICKTDQIAFAALSAMHQYQIAVPEQLSIIGYDNIPESAYTIPALTTIDSGMHDRMAIVVNQIVRLVRPSEETQPAGLPRPQIQVIERASVRRLRVD